MPERIGEYEIVRELGRGGMGVVYEGRHPRLGRRVAIKVLLDPRADAEFTARFAREAQVCARLDHPNLVRVFDAGRASGRPFIVMDFVEGETLAERLRHGPLDADDAATLTATLARALAHAHDHGVLHRDLKPSNVILGARPLLADFGLARDARRERERLTQTGEMLGTPSYMSPEQANGETSIDARTDVYGLGATLYAMLSGGPPFRGGSVMATLKQVLLDPPPPLGPGVDPGLAAVCLRCLAKDPQDRFATARDLAEALERRSVTAAAPRSRAPLVLAAAAGVLAAILVAALTREAPGRPPPEPASAPSLTRPVLPAPASTPDDALERAAAALERRSWSAAHAALDGTDERRRGGAYWLLRGRAHLLEYDYQGTRDGHERAQEAFRRADRLEPTTTTAALRALTGFPKRTDDWRPAAHRAAAGEGAWALLANALLAEGDGRRAEAIHRFELCVKQDPTFVPGWRGLLGNRQEELKQARPTGDLTEAVFKREVLRHMRAARQTDHDPRVLENLAGLFKLRGERLHLRLQRAVDARKYYRQAIESFDHAVQRDQRFLRGVIEAAYTRTLLAACGEVDQPGLRRSVAELGRVLRARPDDDHALQILGDVHIAAGDHPRAIRALERCLRVNPRNRIAAARLEFLREQQRERSPTGSVR